MKKLTISILLSLIACSSVFATEIDADSIYLDEVTIMASSRPKPVILPQRLSGSELQSLSALNVADALRYFSGVQLKDYGGVGGIKTIDIRSMGSQHVGVYYNGIQIGNAQNGVVDLGKFAMDEMEAIELYNGQKSDIFQSAREMGNAGSIYLQSRKPHFTADERVHARAAMRTGSFGLANPSFSLDINLSPSTHSQFSILHSPFPSSLFLTMSASYLRSDGQYPFRYRRLTPSGSVAYDTTAYRHNSDIQAVRAEIGLHHYYSASGYWRIQGYTYWSERGVPGAIVNNVWSNGERLEDRNSFAQFQWQDNFFYRYHIRLLAKYANDYTHYRNLDARTLPTNNTYLQQEVYASLIQQVNILPSWDISVAYDLQYNDLTRQQGLGSVSAPKEQHHRWSHFCSVATAFNIQSYLRVQASALLTHINSNTQLTPAVFISLSPLASLSSPYAKALTINAFYKHSYRYPTFNDLYYTDVGNASLRPELARQASVGLRYEINPSTPNSQFSILNSPFSSSFLMTINYYHNRVTDKIIAFPKGQQFRWAMLNLGEVLINGVDASVGATLHLPMRFSLTPRVQYTYQQAIDVTSPNDSYYRHQIPYIPHHSVSVVSGLTYQSRCADTYGLNYSFIYVGERYAQQENIPANYVPAWSSHDLTIYGEWNIQPIRLHAQLEINNLAGTDYEVIMNYPMPQTSFRATLSIIY